MRVLKGLDHLPTFKFPVITIGTFDGVHSGHKKIIERLRNRAAEVGGESIIITFDPHPRFVLSPENKHVELLTTLDEKIRDLNALQVDNLVIVPFTKDFSELSAEAYVRDFLVNHFHPHTFIIGYDHHFGKNRQGNFSLFETMKDQYHFLLEEIPVQEIEHIAVSSTKIRQALHQGNIQIANQLLGKPYSMEGRIIHGEKRGRLIGFPTANIRIEDAHKLIPANGVYAVKAHWNENVFNGMLNIGIRPTVSNTNQISIEVNLFDVEEEMYDSTLRIELIDRLRDEKKFNSIDELIQQLHLDKIAALKKLQ